MITAFTIMMKARLFIGVIGNLIDTIATLILYYNYGYTEANPIMAILLKTPWLFVCVKLLVMTIIAVWLWRNKDYKNAQAAAWIIAIVYGLIAIYYGIFFTVII